MQCTQVPVVIDDKPTAGSTWDEGCYSGIDKVSFVWVHVSIFNAKTIF